MYRLPTRTTKRAKGAEYAAEDFINYATQREEQCKLKIAIENLGETEYK